MSTFLETFGYRTTNFLEDHCSLSSINQSLTDKQRIDLSRRSLLIIRKRRRERKMLGNQEGVGHSSGYSLKPMIWMRRHAWLETSGPLDIEVHFFLGYLERVSFQGNFNR
jgi:hypothetical protein